MSADVLHDEQALGKAYDARLLLRLWPFLRPYKWLLALDLLIFVPLFALELAPAWIIKHGLDSVFSGGAPGDSPAPALAALGPESAISRWASGLLDPPAPVPPLVWLVLLYALASLALAGIQFLYMYLSAWIG